MPLLKLETTVIINEVKRKSLLNGLSSIMAQTTGKPEEYVMVTINSAAVILMSGDPGRITKLTDQPRPFVLKPFTLSGLLDAVRGVLDSASG